MTLDTDLRSTLRRRADEVQMSPDAWDQIAARLDEPPVSSRKLVAFAGGMVAAALIVIAAFVAQHNGRSSPKVDLVDQPPAAEPLPANIWAGEPGQDAGTVIGAYLKNRLGTHVATTPEVVPGDNMVRATFLSREIATEVFARKVGDQWLVISSASDLVPIHEPTWDGAMTTAIVTPESDGSLMTAFGTEDWDGPHDVQPGESVPVRRGGHGSVRAVLRTSDGTVGLSEVWPSRNPVSVARDFIETQLGLTDTPISLDDFQQGDTTSGEIPYTIEGGSGGTILLAQEDGQWHVTQIVSDDFHVNTTYDKGKAKIEIDPNWDIDGVTFITGRRTNHVLKKPGGSFVIDPRDGSSWVSMIVRRGGRVVAIGRIAVSASSR